ncbi:GNAT family N-acetyltransferase [Acidisoma silvae]|uniref:GNAT family N-acetyltransferase n=1 Tax=Acidisoma silvae TaxID=2802396 RepID=A0A963YPJ7_9PROT|nr:GNAT family N-acetyltransferase [Acidisoma silvae]MCB8874328.1 GNAT family N-acetyltransferase [Acidisoma silvae]
MTMVRPARVTDAAGIAAVHVAAWRSAYPGLLPDHTLTHLNQGQQELYYSRLIRSGRIVHVAVPDVDDPTRHAVIGFVTASRHPHTVIADGEVETLYVLDDFREQGAGRALMRAAAADLAAEGCASVFVWVLSQNPSRWFYERMGGVRTVEGSVRVGGEMQPQTAFVWNPIGRLLG